MSEEFRAETGRVVMGPFEVDNSGVLFPRDEDAPPCFSFEWRGRQMAARLDGAVLRLRARAGLVPSSVAGVPRMPVFDVIRNLPRALPDHWKVTLEPSHAIRIEVELQLDGNVTASSLMTAVTAQMLELGPYLDLLEETGVRGQVSQN